MFKFLITAALLLVAVRLAARALPSAFGAAAAVSRVVRRTLTALLVASVGTLVWSLTDGALWTEQDEGVGLLLFGILFAATWLWRHASDRRRRAARTTLAALEEGEGGASGPVAVPRSARRPRRARVAADRPLDAAWDWAARELDGHRSRVAVARASCERFLSFADARPLDVDAIDWAVFIRSRVPSFLDTARARRRRATVGRLDALDEEVVVTLERIGAEADRRARALDDGTDAFDLERAHIDRRTGRGE